MGKNKYDLIQTVLTLFIFIMIGAVLIIGSGDVKINAYSGYDFYDYELASGSMIASFVLSIIISGFFVESLIKSVELSSDIIKKLSFEYLLLLTFIIISLADLVNQVNQVSYINSTVTIFGKTIFTLQIITIIFIVLILTKNILIDFANILDKKDNTISAKDSYDNLIKLKELFDKGIINETEYNDKRKEYLNNI